MSSPKLKSSKLLGDALNEVASHTCIKPELDKRVKSTDASSASKSDWVPRFDVDKLAKRRTRRNELLVKIAMAGGCLLIGLSIIISIGHFMARYA